MSSMVLAPSDLATWVGSISTSLALIAAGWVVVIELRRDRRATKARESAEQADLVAAWLSQDNFGNYVVDVLNGSQLPVYDVRISVMPEQAILETPGNTRYGEPVDRFPVFPPEKRQVFWDPKATNPDRTTWEAWIWFRDAASREWVRRGDGRLKPVEKTKPRRLLGRRGVR